MDNVRTFWLVDERGEVFDLMGKGTDFFHSAQGFGQSQSVSYSNFSTVRSINKRDNEFQTIKGEMLFSKYSDSNNFRRFINSSNQVVTLYQKVPGVAGEFYAQVNVSMIARGEKELNGLLKCEVSFECLTFWTKEVKIVTVEKEIVEGDTTEVYPYTYTHTYANSPESTSAYLDVLIINNGDIDAPMKITIRGQSISPEWRIGDDRGGLNYTVQNGTELIVDSREYVNEMKVGEMIVDKFKKHEFKNYLLLPTGENKLTFKNVLSVEVLLYEYYLSI